MTNLPALREAVAATITQVALGEPVGPAQAQDVLTMFDALLDEVERLRKENAKLSQQLGEAHELFCENGHADHKDCTSDCACVGQGQSRMEKLEAELETERIENAHLREAFVTMERAANQRETERDTILAHANALERDNAAIRADLAAARALIDKACDALSDDEPIAPDKLVEACALLWAKLDSYAAARAVLESGVPYVYNPPKTPSGLAVWVDRAAWLAWQGKARLT